MHIAETYMLPFSLGFGCHHLWACPSTVHPIGCHLIDLQFCTLVIPLKKKSELMNTCTGQAIVTGQKQQATINNT